jgi:hypothetical protein
MKTVQENFEAQPLNLQEMREVSGGKIKFPTMKSLTKATYVGFLYEFVANFRHAREGFLDGAKGETWQCDTCK